MQYFEENHSKRRTIKPTGQLGSNPVHPVYQLSEENLSAAGGTKGFVKKSGNWPSGARDRRT